MSAIRGQKAGVFSPDRASQRLQSNADVAGASVSILEQLAYAWLPVAGGLMRGTGSTRVDLFHATGVKKVSCVGTLLTVELETLMPDENYLVHLTPHHSDFIGADYYMMTANVARWSKKRDKFSIRAFETYIDSGGSVFPSGMSFQANGDWALSFTVMRGE